MTPTTHLDYLAETELLRLTPEELTAVDAELYELTGIGLGYENFDDFELVINDPNPKSVRFICWPIPGLKTVREARALAELLKAANTPPQQPETQLITSATAAGVPVVDQPGGESSSGAVLRVPLVKFRREAAELDEKMHQAGKQLLEEWFKPLDAVVNPPADTATMSAAEHEELRALREQLAEKHQNYLELERQAREIRRTLQTTSQTAADADATAAAAAPEAPAPQPVQTAPCGAPTSDAQTILNVPPAPAEGPADATAAPALPASLLHPESAALTAPAQETAPHAPPSPASSARPNTTEAGGAHASTQPSQPTQAAS